jgi:hypothetical protein
MIANKLQAFTVMEFTVAMIITSVIIAMGYQSWTILSRQSGRLGNTTQNTLSIHAIDYLLRRDVLEATQIKYEFDELVFHQPTNDLKYTFHTDIIIRHGILPDTFHVKTAKIEKFHQGILIDEGILDDLVITIDLNDMQIPITYHKEYSVEERISNLEAQ